MFLPTKVVRAGAFAAAGGLGALILELLAFLGRIVLADVELVDVEDADEAILQATLGEVDDEAELEVGGLELGADDGALEGADIARAGEQLDDEAVLNEQIGRDRADLALLVHHGDSL